MFCIGFLYTKYVLCQKVLCFYGFGPDYMVPNTFIVDNLNPMFELSAVPPEFSGGIQCRTVGH